MSAVAPATVLEPHAHRTIRGFLRAAEEDDPEVWAFWNLIYGGPDVAVDHATAIAVERELAESLHTVGDVLKGWRPEALKVPA